MDKLDTKKGRPFPSSRSANRTKCTPEKWAIGVMWLAAGVVLSREPHWDSRSRAGFAGSSST